MTTQTQSPTFDKLGAYLTTLSANTESLLGQAAANGRREIEGPLRQAVRVCDHVRRYCAQPNQTEISRMTQVVLSVCTRLSKSPLGDAEPMAQPVRSLVRDYQMLCPLLFERYASVNDSAL